MTKKIVFISNFLLFFCVVHSMDVPQTAQDAKNAPKEVTIDLVLHLPPDAASQRFNQGSSSKSSTGAKTTVRDKSDLLGQIQVQRTKSTGLKKVVKSKIELPDNNEESSIEMIDPTTKNVHYYCQKN